MVAGVSGCGIWLLTVSSCGIWLLTVSGCGIWLLRVSGCHGICLLIIQVFLLDITF